MIKKVIGFSNKLFKEKWMSFFIILLPITFILAFLTVFNLPDSSVAAENTSPVTGKYGLIDFISYLIQGTILAYIPIKLIHDFKNKGHNNELTDYYYGAITYFLRILGVNLGVGLSVLISASPGALIIWAGVGYEVEILGILGAGITIISVGYMSVKLMLSPFILVCENKSISDSIFSSYYLVPNNQVLNIFFTLFIAIFLVVITFGMLSLIVAFGLSPFMSISMEAYIIALTFVTTLLSSLVLIYVNSLMYAIYLNLKSNILNDELTDETS